VSGPLCLAACRERPDRLSGAPGGGLLWWLIAGFIWKSVPTGPQPWGYNARPIWCCTVVRAVCVPPSPDFGCSSGGNQAPRSAWLASPWFLAGVSPGGLPPRWRWPVAASIHVAGRAPLLPTIMTRVGTGLQSFRGTFVCSAGTLALGYANCCNQTAPCRSPPKSECAPPTRGLALPGVIGCRKPTND